MNSVDEGCMPAGVCFILAASYYSPKTYVLGSLKTGELPIVVNANACLSLCTVIDW